jgi:hypothetical protein
MKQEGESSNRVECHHPRRRAGLWMNLRNASVISILIHSCAGLVMFFILREGLDTNPDFSLRMMFLAEHKAAWVLSWLVWNAAAFSILYFYFSFVRAHHRWSESNSEEKATRKPFARLSAMHFAFALSIAAVALDLGAESIQMGVLPELAAKYPPVDPRQISLKPGVPGLTQDGNLPSPILTKVLFDAFNRTSIMLTGCMANFLYTATATILLIATRKRYGIVTLISGVLVAISGTCLSAACILNSVPGMFWTNAFLLPALSIWQLTIALDAQKRGREAAKTEAAPEARQQRQ